MQTEIGTLRHTSSEQCELVFLGAFGHRLRLWVQGALVIDEEVSGAEHALECARRLRVDWQHTREPLGWRMRGRKGRHGTSKD